MNPARSIPARPRFAVVFYRQAKRARYFRARSFDMATAIADRFAERLEAVAFIHETPTVRGAPIVFHLPM